MPSKIFFVFKTSNVRQQLCEALEDLDNELRQALPDHVALTVEIEVKTKIPMAEIVENVKAIAREMVTEFNKDAGPGGVKVNINVDKYHKEI